MVFRQTVAISMLFAATLFQCITARAQTYTLLYSFGGSNSPGVGPSGLVQIGNSLYGATSGGGQYNYGSIFVMQPPGLAGGPPF